MESAISISEILGTICDDTVEVCATANTRYDSSEEKVVVALNAFARRVSADRHGEHLSQPWLPPDEQVVEHLPREDVASFAKDVFHSWVKKVRDSVPDELRLHT